MLNYQRVESDDAEEEEEEDIKVLNGVDVCG